MLSVFMLAMVENMTLKKILGTKAKQHKPKLNVTSQRKAS